MGPLSENISNTTSNAVVELLGIWNTKHQTGLARQCTTRSEGNRTYGKQTQPGVRSQSVRPSQRSKSTTLSEGNRAHGSGELVLNTDAARLGRPDVTQNNRNTTMRFLTEDEARAL